MLLVLLANDAGKDRLGLANPVTGREQSPLQFVAGARRQFPGAELGEDLGSRLGEYRGEKHRQMSAGFTEVDKNG